MQHKGREKAVKVVEFLAKLLNVCPSTVPEMNNFGMGWRTLADGHERVVAITQWPNALSLRLHQ